MKKSTLISLLCTSLLMTGCGLWGNDTAPTVMAPTEEISQEPAATEEKNTVPDKAAAEPEYDGDIITMDRSENAFVSAVSSEFKYSDFGSFVVDLDRDGKEEAFVFDGNEESFVKDIDSKLYFYGDTFWFVDEDLNATKLDDLCGLEICSEQSKITLDDRDYLAINGYMGADGNGVVYTVMDDKLTNALNGAWGKGHKRFLNGEVIWLAEPMNHYVGRDPGVAIKDGLQNGYVQHPYAMYYDNGFFTCYGAKNITKEEAEAITGFSLEPMDPLSTEYIYRDNYEIEVNYVNMDEFDYCFNTDIYTSVDGGKTWYFKKTNDGYYYVDLSKDSDWEFLSTIME